MSCAEREGRLRGEEREARNPSVLNRCPAGMRNLRCTCLVCIRPPPLTHCVNPAGWTELSGDVGMAEGSVVTALVASKLLLPAELSPREPCGTGHRAGSRSDEL